jgi:hypothetical protein
MRKLIFILVIMHALNTVAQNYTTGNIIEGGKTLVELVKVFKTPKNNLVMQNTVEKKDSCAIKSVSDLCIKNATGTSLLVSLFKRNGNGYETGSLSASILPRNQECWFELKSGIYKYKLEMKEGDSLKLFRQGELKLEACSNLVREIKEN